jgi:carboxypeptidase C (cathepsin A)
MKVAIRRISWSTLALAAWLLAACGGGGGGGSASVTPTPTPTPPVTTPVPGEYADPNTYASNATGSLATPNENAAVIAAHIQLNGKQFNYTATTGHLTATDTRTGQVSASFFYVAYTTGTAGADLSKRPVTFFYNGGPGSASMWLHLGSFGPRRLVSTIPSATIPPVQLVDNQETLLERSDLVFVDAIGTGYSTAIAPRTNQEFWGVDKDAAAFRDFVQRYVAVNKREASPKYLFGESYGAPRTAVLANLLETAGVQVDGIMLQSSIMNYNSNCGVLDPGTISCEGYVPTYAATGAYFQRSTPPLPADFSAYLQQARAFATGDYRTAMTAWLAGHVAPPAGVVTQLVNLTGLPTLMWQQDFDLGPDKFQKNVLPNQLVGRYDARVSAPFGSALAQGGDPSLAVVNNAFTGSIGGYLAGELHYTAHSAYSSFIDIVNTWNFSHDGKNLPDTIPDLAAALAQNPAMKILSLNGYFDLATPYHQTELDLARLGSVPALQYKYYSAGHMSYLDDTARRAQQLDLLNFYGPPQ